MRKYKTIRHVSIAVFLGLTVAGCNTLNRLADLGSEPEVTTIQNPTTKPGYKPVSMPMPAPVRVPHNPNSLWRKGSSAFF